ncbi:MAG: alpha/beta hydrolase [Firmicutes bacterium]|nr:alpha/beta hydrolase [Bacillota bacterium]
MIEKTIYSQRGKLYYWISRHPEKTAKTVAFLPGLTANHHLFDLQTEYFSADYTVLVWDPPAHGKSRPYRDFSYTHSAEELKRILATENLDRVVLAGQSAGGFVAQLFASKYPFAVDGLFLIGSCPFEPEYYSKSDLSWLKRTKWVTGMFSDRKLRDTMARMCGATEEGRENMRQMLEDYDKKELCSLMDLGFAGFILEMGDVEIKCPVWLVTGEKDKTGKVKKYNRLWHEKEGYPLHIISRAAHNANYDNAEEVNRLLEQFVKKLG